jgi:transposase
MPKTRRAFTDEFKREAVKLVKQPGAKVTHIARDLGIEQSVLRRWVSQEHGGVMDMRANKPLRIESASEVKRLQRELRRVTTERDILKKSARLLCKGLAVNYAFVVRHRDVWTTRAMCRVMNVSASGFYEWFGRPASEHSQTDTRLTRSIRESFELSDRTYGSPRVWHDLRAAGEQCGINRVQPRDAPDEGGEPAGQAQAP